MPPFDKPELLDMTDTEIVKEIDRIEEGIEVFKSYLKAAEQKKRQWDEMNRLSGSFVSKDGKIIIKNATGSIIGSNIEKASITSSNQRFPEQGHLDGLKFLIAEWSTYLQFAQDELLKRQRTQK